jgi:hypothetical protein
MLIGLRIRDQERFIPLRVKIRRTQCVKIQSVMPQIVLQKLKRTASTKISRKGAHRTFRLESP